MTYTCKHCRHGHERAPEGNRPPAGTVWCAKRKIAIGQNRNMSCFIPTVSEKSKRCQDCKWARILKPTGGAPEIGRVWCEKRHFETNKLRTMECFE